MIETRVSSTKRTLTLELSPEDARELLNEFPKDRDPTYAWRRLLGPLHAIANNREYGGN